jgi:mxaJ protein
MLSRLESEPSVVWNGMGIAVCLAAFGLGIVAASDHGPILPKTPELRICADPNNLPFSNRAAQGFENEIAELIAQDLGVALSYTWIPERNSFFRNTLDDGRCDVVLGVPSSGSRLLTTQPYYRSTYVFVQRASLTDPIRSLSDPRLGQLRIGINMRGDEFNSLPPGIALVSRGLDDRMSPPHEQIQAVADGRIDLAIDRGPLAGYFARISSQPLALTPVPSGKGAAAAQLTYDIAMGVRRNDSALRHALDGALSRRHTEIAAILAQYGVPVVTADPELANRR